MTSRNISLIDALNEAKTSEYGDWDEKVVDLKENEEITAESIQNMEMDIEKDDDGRGLNGASIMKSYIPHRNNGNSSSSCSSKIDEDDDNIFDDNNMMIDNDNNNIKGYKDSNLYSTILHYPLNSHHSLDLRLEYLI